MIQEIIIFIVFVAALIFIIRSIAMPFIKKDVKCRACSSDCGCGIKIPDTSNSSKDNN